MKNRNELRKSFRLKYGQNLINQLNAPRERQAEYIKIYNKRTQENLIQIRKWFKEQEESHEDNFVADNEQH